MLLAKLPPFYLLLLLRLLLFLLLLLLLLLLSCDNKIVVGKCVFAAAKTCTFGTENVKKRPPKKDRRMTASVLKLNPNT